MRAIFLFTLLSCSLAWSGPQGARLSLGSSGLRFHPTPQVNIQGPCNLKRRGTIDCLRGEFAGGSLRAQTEALSAQDSNLSMRALCDRSTQALPQVKKSIFKVGAREICRASAPGLEIYFEKHKLFWVSISFQNHENWNSGQISELRKWVEQAKYE